MPYIDELEIPNGSVYDVKDTKSGYATKLPSATAGNIPVLKADGSTEDSGYKPSDLIQSNLNLLDNPFFTINQRGQNSYSGNVCAIDRWVIGDNGSVSFSNGVLTVTKVNTYAMIYQYFDTKLINALIGRKVTASITLDDNSVLKGTTTFALNTVLLNEQGIVVDFTTNLIRVYSTDTFAIKNVKLEIGEASTLALDTAPNYHIELVKCQTSTADPSDTYANKGNIVTSNSIAPTEDGATCQNPNGYKIGEHFFRGGEYCVCKTAIASGASFTLNTNYEVTTLANETEAKGRISVTGTYASGVHVRRIGRNFISVRIAIGGSQNIPSGTTLATLPSDIKPITDATMPVLITGSGAFGNVLLNALGDIIYYGSSAASLMFGSTIYEIN